MLPFPKRQRLYPPLGREFPQSFENQHAYYDQSPDPILEEEDFEEDDFEDMEDEEPLDDPETDLQQKRARVDYKLKSTFESIFEKYGKDFDGVGDEIDLATGEILVDNGHLREMQNERDAGDLRRATNALREFTEEPDDLPSSSIEETEILDDEVDDEEDEEDTEEDLSDEDMLEDDLILRGFSQAVRFVQPSPEFGPSSEAIIPRKERRQYAAPRPIMQGTALHSRSDIRAQFGPPVGLQAVNYVRQQVPDDSHIEPIWRAPELPAMAAVRRQTIRNAVLAPEIERSPSPDAATRSIWAPVGTRRRRRVNGADSNPSFLGSSMVPNQVRASQTFNHFQRQPAVGFAVPLQASPPRAKRRRVPFSAADDKVLLDWVAQGRERGAPFWSKSRWREFEAKVISISHKSSCQC